MRRRFWEQTLRVLDQTGTDSQLRNQLVCCTQIAAFNLALAAWRRVGYCVFPPMNLACSGLAPNTSKEWLKLAGESEKLQGGMERLYELFSQSEVLGSLINPRAGEGDLLEAGFNEIQPFLEQALANENTDYKLQDSSLYELTVTARGLAKAAEILAGQFTLVATNVPYLGRGKQNEVLQDFSYRNYPRSVENLGTAFVERCCDLNAEGGATALVTPENWLYLGVYRQLGESLLLKTQWVCIAKLGSKSFQTPMWDFNVILFAVVKSTLDKNHTFFNLSAADALTPDSKASTLTEAGLTSVEQLVQLRNPDARVVDMLIDASLLLDRHAEGFKGFPKPLDKPVCFYWCFTLSAPPTISQGATGTFNPWVLVRAPALSFAKNPGFSWWTLEKLGFFRAYCCRFQFRPNGVNSHLDAKNRTLTANLSATLLRSSVGLVAAMVIERCRVGVELCSGIGD